MKLSIRDKIHIISSNDLRGCEDQFSKFVELRGLTTEIKNVSLSTPADKDGKVTSYILTIHYCQY